MKDYIRLLTYTVVVSLLSGCSTTTQVSSSNAAHNNFNSTLWVQTSSEYKANSIQAYSMALKNIKLVLNDHNWSAAYEQDGDYSSLDPAVVMDIDETVLDNSKYQATLVMENGEWNSKTWDDWIAQKEATAVPGAVEFINEMHNKNIEVIFITNRECIKRESSSLECPQQNDTIQNLSNVGVVNVNPEIIHLKNEKETWSSEKKSRREYVSREYRILMLFGDDLGDFLPNVKGDITLEERDRLVTKFHNNWGKGWYMLPNPTYGSWIRVLDSPKSQYLKTY